MNKDKWIEEQVKIFLLRKNEYDGRIDFDEKLAKEFWKDEWSNFFRQSLDDAYTLGSMEGYKEGLSSKEAIEEIAEQMIQSRKK